VGSRPTAGRRSAAASRPRDGAGSGARQHRGAAAEHPARALGEPIQAPVGEAVLGRLLNVIGEPVDRGPCLPAGIPFAPIHAEAPALDRQTGAQQIFHTGIKVIDLLAPLIEGGKAAMFGGAGVGKTVLIMELIRTTVERHAGPRAGSAQIGVGDACDVKRANHTMSAQSDANSSDADQFSGEVLEKLHLI
jgi:F0F1-type ATP synthase beta subunit